MHGGGVHRHSAQSHAGALQQRNRGDGGRGEGWPVFHDDGVEGSTPFLHSSGAGFGGGVVGGGLGVDVDNGCTRIFKYLIVKHIVGNGAFVVFFSRIFAFLRHIFPCMNGALALLFCYFVLCFCFVLCLCSFVLCFVLLVFALHVFRCCSFVCFELNCVLSFRGRVLLWTLNANRRKEENKQGTKGNKLTKK